MSDSSSDDDAFVAKCLADLLKDRRNGIVRPIEEYQSRAGAYAENVRRALEEALRNLDLANQEVDPTMGGPNVRKVAHYRLLRSLGRGGQGEVWLADDDRLRRRVALKLLGSAGWLSTEFRSRFQREAEVLARIDHPGICAVYDAGVADGRPYIAMQWVPGETLAERIKKGLTPKTKDEFSLFVVDLKPTEVDSEKTGAEVVATTSRPSVALTRIELERTVSVFERIARALHAAHEKGVIHRDIKPGNIMITPSGDPVLLDFGLAAIDSPGDEILTRSGDVFGTPSYMSPEQIAGRSGTIDARTDVWSLGVTLYECVAKRRPFEAPTREGIYQAILTRDAPDLRRLCPMASADLRTVIATALEKSPDRRYRSALDLAEDLRRVGLRQPILARPVPAFARALRFAARHPGTAIAASAAFLILVAGIVVTQILLARAERNLRDYNRLADARVLEDLVLEQEQDLWPAVPAKLPAMERWLRRAEALSSTLPDHERTLADLEVRAIQEKTGGSPRTATNFSEASERVSHFDTRIKSIEAELAALGRDGGSDSRLVRRVEHLEDELADTRAQGERLRSALDRQVTASRPREFPDPATAWQYDKLSALVAALRHFVADDRSGSGIASVRERVEFARSLSARTLEGEAESWANALRRIAANPKYGGLVFRPQLGLIPLGADPQSTFEEFCDTATGERPARASDGRLVLSPSSALVLVLLPGGTVKLGAQPGDPDAPNFDPLAEPDESPVYDAVIEPFFCSAFELTQGQFLRFTGQNPSFYLPGQELRGHGAITLRNPAEQLSHDEARKFLARLGLCLPTEAQWEYSCRGGTSTPWSTGRNYALLERVANLGDASLVDSGGASPGEVWDDGFPAHAPVGSFEPNAFGLYDLHGNVWEWCADDYRRSYDRRLGPPDGLRLPTGVPFRVYRGGSFMFPGPVARSAGRHRADPSNRYSDFGVRPVRPLER